MIYNADTVKIGYITDQIFISDNGLGFDFSDKSQVTFVQFNGIGGPDTATIAKTLSFWKNYFYNKLGHHVNVVTIRDGSRDFGI